MPQQKRVFNPLNLLPLPLTTVLNASFLEEAEFELSQIGGFGYTKRGYKILVTRARNCIFFPSREVAERYIALCNAMDSHAEGTKFCAKFKETHRILRVEQALRVSGLTAVTHSARDNLPIISIDSPGILQSIFRHFGLLDPAVAP